MDYITTGFEAKGDLLIFKRQRESEAHLTMDNFRAYPRQGERQTLNGLCRRSQPGTGPKVGCSLSQPIGGDRVTTHKKENINE
jgi:hypothetical protein